MTIIPEENPKSQIILQNPKAFQDQEDNLLKWTDLLLEVNTKITTMDILPETQGITMEIISKEPKVLPTTAEFTEEDRDTTILNHTIQDMMIEGKVS